MIYCVDVGGIALWLNNTAHVPSLALQVWIAHQRIIDSQFIAFLMDEDGIIGGYLLYKGKETANLNLDGNRKIR